MATFVFGVVIPLPQTLAEQWCKEACYRCQATGTGQDQSLWPAEVRSEIILTLGNLPIGVKGLDKLSLAIAMKDWT